LNTGVAVSISRMRLTSQSRAAATPFLGLPRGAARGLVEHRQAGAEHSSTSIQPASWVKPKIRTSTGGSS
jgi:hypothetical protein